MRIKGINPFCPRRFNFICTYCKRRANKHKQLTNMDVLCYNMQMNEGFAAERDLHQRARQASRERVANSTEDLRALTTANAGLKAEVQYHQTVLDWVSAEKDYWRDQATRDALTGLLNKRGLDEQLSQKLEQATAEDNIGLFYIDLTNFKRVNDEQGHQTGDEVLVGVANILEHNFRKEDKLSYVGRTGGDEFITLCDLKPRHDGNNKLTTEERMDSIREKLTLAFDDFSIGIIEGESSLESMQFDVSIGQAIWEPGMNTEQFIKLAEEDMYLHKAQQHQENGSYR